MDMVDRSVLEPKTGGMEPQFLEAEYVITDVVFMPLVGHSFWKIYEGKLLYLYSPLKFRMRSSRVISE